MTGLVGVAAVIGCASIGGIVRWRATAINTTLPVGTFLVNVIASFLLGYLNTLEGPVGVAIRIGLLGALSTWSTLAAEVTKMWRDGRRNESLAYLSATVGVGIAAAAVGLAWAP